MDARTTIIFRGIVKNLEIAGYKPTRGKSAAVDSYMGVDAGGICVDRSNNPVKLGNFALTSRQYGSITLTSGDIRFTYDIQPDVKQLVHAVIMHFAGPGDFDFSSAMSFIMTTHALAVNALGSTFENALYQIVLHEAEKNAAVAKATELTNVVEKYEVAGNKLSAENLRLREMIDVLAKKIADLTNELSKTAKRLIASSEDAESLIDKIESLEGELSASRAECHQLRAEIAQLDASKCFGQPKHG